jgi:glutaredoxin 3
MSRITMYGTSWCGFCAMARRLLESKGQRWDEIDVDAVPGSREEMMQRSGRRTVPQIWIGERHVGGYDDLAALERAGELDALLAAAAGSGGAEG